MILAGDIGGTKTILALYELRAGTLHELKKQQFQSADFTGIASLIQLFLSTHGVTQLERVCLGVAGPIVNGDCVATNLPWHIERASISAQLQLELSQIRLLNDLEATAWGILNLPLNDFVSLNPLGKKQPGHLAIIAAGTGLGEAIVCWDGQDYTVMPSEGGHVDFAPTSQHEIGLLQYLLQKYPDHVSYERVVSGMGLVNIYDYLKHSQYAPEQTAVAEKMQQQDVAAVISEYGQSGTDPLCAEALRLFCRLYGAQAGNLALTVLPQNGVVLAGGIAAKILPLLQQGDFMQGFLAKGRYYAAMQAFSVQVCTNHEAALLGAAYFSLKLP